MCSLAARLASRAIHSWNFPLSGIRRIAEKDGRVLPEHIDFMERLAQRWVASTLACWLARAQHLPAGPCTCCLRAGVPTHCI